MSHFNSFWAPWPKNVISYAGTSTTDYSNRCVHIGEASRSYQAAKRTHMKDLRICFLILVGTIHLPSTAHAHHPRNCYRPSRRQTNQQSPFYSNHKFSGDLEVFKLIKKTLHVFARRVCSLPCLCGDLTNNNKKNNSLCIFNVFLFATQEPSKSALLSGCCTDVVYPPLSKKKKKNTLT